MFKSLFRVIAPDALIPIRNGIVVERGTCVHLMVSWRAKESKFFVFALGSRCRFESPIYWLRITLGRRAPRLQTASGVMAARDFDAGAA